MMRARHNLHDSVPNGWSTARAKRESLMDSLAKLEAALVASSLAESRVPSVH